MANWQLWGSFLLKIKIEQKRELDIFLFKRENSSKAFKKLLGHLTWESAVKTIHSKRVKKNILIMYFPTNIFSWFISLLKDCRFNWNNTIVHYVKSVRIRSYLGPHFSRIFPHSDWIGRNTEYLSVFSPNAGKCRKNADQNNSEYRHFSRSGYFSFTSLKRSKSACKKYFFDYWQLELVAFTLFIGLTLIFIWA